MTEFEERILKAAVDAGDKRLTVEELAVKADCKPIEIYRRLQDSEFRGLFLDTLRNTLAGETPAVVNAMVLKAVDGDFRAAKLILELSGMYREKKEIMADVGLQEGSVFNDAESRREFLMATLVPRMLKEDES